MRDFETLTDKSNKRRICNFLGCSTPLSTYNKSGFCSIHEKPEYQQVAVHLETLEEELKKAKANQPAETKVLFANKVCGAYEVVERDGFRIIAERGIEENRFYLDRDPDLFIRFIGLSESEEAYLGFVLRYGFLGLKRYREDSSGIIANLWHIEFKNDEEPIFLIKHFHQDLKRFFEMIRRRQNGGPIKSRERRDFEGWLRDLFGYDIVARLVLRSDINFKPKLSAVIIPETLAGALVLQLYELLKFDKPPKVCALPGCSILTMRKRFCSDQHYNLFNTWRKRSSEDVKHFLRKFGELGQEYTMIFTKKELKSLLSKWNAEGLLSKEELKAIKNCDK